MEGNWTCNIKYIIQQGIFKYFYSAKGCVKFLKRHSKDIYDATKDFKSPKCCSLELTEKCQKKVLAKNIGK